MASNPLTGGLAMGVTPAVSAAMTMSSTLSTEIDPCSQSISTQSKPSRPTMSTMCGDGNMIETPNAGSPTRSFCFMRFGFMVSIRLKDCLLAVAGVASDRRIIPSSERHPRGYEHLKHV